MTRGADRTLTLLCEAPSSQLPALFTPERVASVKRLAGRISLALPTFDRARADVVRRLNEQQIPVVAWLLLSEEEGVYYNVDNARSALINYDGFLDWTEAEGLEWQAVAFDFEPLCGLSRQLQTHRRFARFARRAVIRAARRDAFEHASTTFRTLVTDAHRRGLRVEAYHLPIVADDRSAQSDLLRRLVGTPNVRVDAETLMVYTSFERHLGPAIVADYARDADALALGVTGAPPGAARLRWDELACDLRLAAPYTRHISIHSYEGCVEHDMLDRLEEFDWEGGGTLGARTAWSPCIRLARGAVRMALRGAAHLSELRA